MITESSKGTRAYRKRLRAKQEAETRQRITQAAMELHGSVGPARTTIKAVAERAGVQRATVYRHFPDERALFAACSAHWSSLNPPPDPARWSEIADPDERLRTALAELYAWYGWAEPMLTNTTRDAALVPAVRELQEQSRAAYETMAATLLRGRSARGRPRRRVRAAIAHALGFGTWRSLVFEAGLANHEAVELMVATAAAAGELRAA